MEETIRTEGQSEPETISDEEWAQMQREAMGENYPGDAEMQREREEFEREFEERNAAEAQAEAAAPAAPEAREWNAGDWLRETFKDDPNFDQLSEADFARLEAMANEKHGELEGEIKDWAAEKGPEWARELTDGINEGMASNPKLQEFMETRLADGDFSDEDKAALKEIGEDMSPAEAAGVIRPIAEAGHEIHGELIDGVEMIVDNAIEDIDEIVDARAEMPGGDSPEIQAMQEKLDQAPEQVHDALDWEREQADYQWGKVEDRLELVEAGVDPQDLPPDTDTYQVDPNTQEYADEAA